MRLAGWYPDWAAARNSGAASRKGARVDARDISPASRPRRARPSRGGHGGDTAGCSRGPGRAEPISGPWDPAATDGAQRGNAPGDRWRLQMRRCRPPPRRRRRRWIWDANSSAVSGHHRPDSQPASTLSANPRQRKAGHRYVIRRAGSPDGCAVLLGRRQPDRPSLGIDSARRHGQFDCSIDSGTPSPASVYCPGSPEPNTTRAAKSVRGQARRPVVLGRRRGQHESPLPRRRTDARSAANRCSGEDFTGAHRGA